MYKDQWRQIVLSCTVIVALAIVAIYTTDCSEGNVDRKVPYFGYGSEQLSNFTGNVYFDPLYLYRSDRIYRTIDTLEVTANIQKVLDSSTSYTEILHAVMALQNMNSFVVFKPLDIREVVFTNRLSLYSGYVYGAADVFGLDPNIIKAIIVQESNVNRYAISRAGAKGLMQLMDNTARYVGVADVWDPHDNIMGGAAYFKEQLDRFGDLSLALAAYNAGPEAVVRFGGIPPYRETRDYVINVLKFKHYFDTLGNPKLYAYLRDTGGY